MGLTLIPLLHYTELCAITYGHPVGWLAVDAAALYLLWRLFLLRRRWNKKGGQQQQVKRRNGSRSPYNTHGAAADKPVWRNLPRHATLLLDTNVLMCPDAAIRSWFGYLLHQSKQNGWRIVVIGAVYEEIMHHLKHGNEEKAKDARLARNRIESLTDELGDGMVMEGLQQRQSAPGTRDIYADPQLIDYMCEHRNTLLFTFDNDLKIRCKHLMRSKQPKNKVYSEENFYEAP